MGFLRRWARRTLESMASSQGETVVVVPRIGAAVVLREGEALFTVLPTPEVFRLEDSARPIALMMAAGAVIMRDYQDNLSLYEGVVRAAEEFGFTRDQGKLWAGDLVGHDVSMGAPA